MCSAQETSVCILPRCLLIYKFLLLLPSFLFPALCAGREADATKGSSPPTASLGPSFQRLQAAIAASSGRIEPKLVPYPGQRPWQWGRCGWGNECVGCGALLGFVLAGMPNDPIRFRWKVVIPKLLNGHVNHSGLWDEYFCLLCLHSWRSMIAFGRNWFGHFT